MSKAAHKTLSKFVHSTMREWILTGRYEPGARLDQAALINELEVSLIPLRETLRQLEAEGLVKIYPHRGAFVAERSPSEVQEIARIRVVLEELAVQQAVLCLDEATLQRMTKLNKQMDQAVRSKDMARMLSLNEQFHFVIYEACDQPLLLQMIRSLWDRNRLYRQRTLYNEAQVRQSQVEHREMLAALQSRDAKQAGRVIRQHIQRVTHDILVKISEADAKATKG
jgi:DNA-binding GntR family transcriptional regulator